MSDNLHPQTLTLPERPSLEHLRHQAKDLQEQRNLSLQEAQLELARSYGFSSWTTLKRYVELVTGQRTVRDVWIELALGGQLDQADAFLAENPTWKSDPLIRMMSGHPDPSLDAAMPTGPRNWVPLLYACFTRFHDRDGARPGLRAVIQDLLNRGADPNAFWIHPEYPEPPQTCVAGVCGTNNHPEALRLLLEAGAHPSDGEAMYHGTEFDGHEGLQLLFEFGGSPKGTNGLAHMLDRDDLPGLELYLRHYGEPDEELHRSLHGAITRHRSPAHVRALLDAGADATVRYHGVSAALVARMLDQEETARLLEGRGAGTEMSDVERLVLRALHGEDVRVSEVPDHLRLVLGFAAQRGNALQVASLLRAGFPATHPVSMGLTPLHEACFYGQTEVIRLLLDAGADMGVRDTGHNGTPLNWCAYGCSVRQNPAGDYAGSVLLMLERGGIRHCDPDWVRRLVTSPPELVAAIEAAIQGLEENS